MQNFDGRCRSVSQLVQKLCLFEVFTEPKFEPTIYDNSQNIDFFKQKFNSKDASPFIKK